jgi:hypothetical protein
MKAKPKVKPKWDAAYKKVVVRELGKFFEDRDMSITQFCCNVNAWRIKHKREPIEGTPFMMQGKLMEWKRKWSNCIQVSAKKVM